MYGTWHATHNEFAALGLATHLRNYLQVQKLMDMGFGKATVIQALHDAHGDENAALDLILSR